MRLSIHCFLITLLYLSPGQSAAQYSISGANRADAVVVGRISGGANQADGVTFSLTVVRSISGEVQAGQVVTVDAKLRLRSGMNPKRQVQGQCGLFVLRRTPSAWEIVGSSNSPFLSGTYYPMGDCETSEAEFTGELTAYEKSILEIVSSAERDSSIAKQIDLFSVTARSSSAVVSDLMNRLSRSSASAQLRVQGLAWRVAQGDAAAVQELCNMALEPHDEPIRLTGFSSAIREYANTDRNAVVTLGEFLYNPEVKDIYLKRGIAHALRNIHTMDAAPFLARMLDSSDQEVRTEAVSGLTEYTLGIRAAAGSRDKSAALGEVLNPGRNPDAPNLAEQDHLHIGPFMNPEQESSLLAYWKQWWRQHQQDPQFR